VDVLPVSTHRAVVADRNRAVYGKVTQARDLHGLDTSDD